jgi:hypothetical protein
MIDRIRTTLTLNLELCMGLLCLNGGQCLQPLCRINHNQGIKLYFLNLCEQKIHDLLLRR